MSVFNALHAAFFTKLNVSALTDELGGAYIYNLQAPDHQDMPYVVFSLAAGADENITPSRMKDQLYFIRAYAATAKEAGEIDAVIDGLLHDQELSITGWANYWLAREDEFSIIENQESGDKNYMAGANYRLRLSQN